MALLTRLCDKAADVECSCNKCSTKVMTQHICNDYDSIKLGKTKTFNVKIDYYAIPLETKRASASQFMQMHQCYLSINVYRATGAG